jgi:hypothetical protein
VGVNFDGSAAELFLAAPAVALPEAVIGIRNQTSKREEKEKTGSGVTLREASLEARRAGKKPALHPRLVLGILSDFPRMLTQLLHYLLSIICPLVRENYGRTLSG